MRKFVPTLAYSPGGLLGNCSSPVYSWVIVTLWLKLRLKISSHGLTIIEPHEPVVKPFFPQ